MKTPRPGYLDDLVAVWIRQGFRGATRISRLTGRSTSVLVSSHSDAVFSLNPSAYIDQIVVKEGFYESEVGLEIERAAGKGETVWDIGANFGLHSITLGKLRPDLQIVAFEPNPAEHARLMLHRDWNAPHIRTCSLALSDRNALLELHLGPVGNSGMTTLSPWSEATYAGTVLVSAVRGDDLIATGRIKAPNVIKIDVEGHEAAVLRGLAQTLKRDTCHTIVFEDGPDSDTEAKQLLRAAGFQISRLERSEHTAHALSNFVAKKAGTA